MGLLMPEGWRDRFYEEGGLGEREGAEWAAAPRAAEDLGSRGRVKATGPGRPRLLREGDL